MVPCPQVTRSRDEWERKMALYRAVQSCRVLTKATATSQHAQHKQRPTTRSPYCDIGRYGAEWANRTFTTLNQEYRDAVYRENECRMIPPVYNSRNGRPRPFPSAQVSHSAS